MIATSGSESDCCSSNSSSGSSSDSDSSSSSSNSDAESDEYDSNDESESDSDDCKVRRNFKKEHQVKANKKKKLQQIRSK